MLAWCLAFLRTTYGRRRRGKTDDALSLAAPAQWFEADETDEPDQPDSEPIDIADGLDAWGVHLSAITEQDLPTLRWIVPRKRTPAGHQRQIPLAFTPRPVQLTIPFDLYELTRNRAA